MKRILKDNRRNAKGAMRNMYVHAANMERVLWMPSTWLLLGYAVIVSFFFFFVLETYNIAMKVVNFGSVV